MVYHVDCYTQYASSEQVLWTLNDVKVMNSISHQVVNMTTEKWKSTLTVMRKEHETQNNIISCNVMNVTGQLLIIEGWFLALL